MNGFSDFLKLSDIEYREDFPLSEISTFKIGGNADILIFPNTEEKLISAIKEIRRRNLSYAVIGNTSNSIFADEGYRGVIISTKKLCNINIESTEYGADIICECGVMLPVAAQRVAQLSLSGLEFACGIPGTVGGAVFMNAGAHGLSMSDVLVSSKAYDAENDRVITFHGEENKLSYRESVYSSNSSLVCLDAVIRLVHGNKDEIKEKMRENTEKRKNTQPLGLPSAGSFFKRPEGYFAAKLIDECGLKGYRIGDAAVSEIHAGFLVNLGNASAKDIFSLAEYISEFVFEKTGVKLHREVRYINSGE